jgi:hypothetical protein
MLHNVCRGSLAVTIAMFVCVTAAGVTAQRSETEGIKETERFIKAGGGTSEVLVEAKAQVQSTLASYNALVTEPSKDMKGDYKKLMKSVKDMNSKLADARGKVAEMERAGNTYFAGRTASIKNIQDAGLRSQAEQRLTQNQQELARVMGSLQEVAKSLEPIRKELADQITYLGSDLTDSGTASLKPRAEKLNQQGVETFGKADQAIAVANNYFNSMRPQK